MAKLIHEWGLGKEGENYRLVQAWGAAYGGVFVLEKSRKAVLNDVSWDEIARWCPKAMTNTAEEDVRTALATAIEQLKQQVDACHSVSARLEKERNANYAESFSLTQANAVLNARVELLENTLEDLGVELVDADVCMGCSLDRVRGRCPNPSCTWQANIDKVEV